MALEIPILQRGVHLCTSWDSEDESQAPRTRRPRHEDGAGPMCELFVVNPETQRQWLSDSARDSPENLASGTLGMRSRGSAVATSQLSPGRAFSHEWVAGN